MLYAYVNTMVQNVLPQEPVFIYAKSSSNYVDVYVS